MDNEFTVWLVVLTQTYEFAINNSQPFRQSNSSYPNCIPIAAINISPFLQYRNYLKIFNNILSALDIGKNTVHTLLDLSAALDTIHHDILLHCLQHVFSIQNTALHWFTSYLVNWTQIVSANEINSSPVYICCGVSQGSVIGPVFFILYTRLLSTVIDHHPAFHQLYADDTHIYKSIHPTEVNGTIQSSVVHFWCEIMNDMYKSCWWMMIKLKPFWSQRKYFFIHIPYLKQ